MEDIRKHLGIDPNDIVNNFNDILELAQEALEDEICQRDVWDLEGGNLSDFEMDFGGLEEEQNYGLLQALRRIFK